MALGPGSIAFVGFNADGADNLAFVVLEDIVAGTVIHFTNNEWTGSAFNTGESAWSWTATNAIAAGTIVTMDALSSAATASSNLGAIAFSGPATGLTISNEAVYAYVGAPEVPSAFLAAIANDDFGAAGGSLTNTGLVLGTHAINIDGIDADADIASFNGARLVGTAFSELLASINNPKNWITQDTGADDSNDVTAPNVPFSMVPFVLDPSAQKIFFAPSSLTVTKSEGDVGATLTFTVERTNGTTGEVNFSGVFTAATVNADDFGGVLPTAFTGTIADGAASGTVTITISGDTLFEPDEDFTLTLNNATNAAAAVYVSTVPAETVATGVIVNNDTVQTIGFAEDSLEVFVVEGNDGTKTITFTVERTGTGGNEGAVDFSGEFFPQATLDAGDFGGTLPSTTFTGTIADGANSATVSFTISGDLAGEAHERFNLFLNSVSNPSADTIVIDDSHMYAYGNILNDDGPLVVHAGETITHEIGLTGQTSLTIEEGGVLQQGLSFAGPGLDAVVNNASSIDAFFLGEQVDGKIVFNNLATGVVTGRSEIATLKAGSEVIINNAGLFTGAHKVIKSEGSGEGYHVTINNLAGGRIDSGADSQKAIVVRSNVDINNAGTIIVPAEDGTTDAGGEAIEYTGENVTLHNLAGGWIEGSHHAFTGEDATTVTNDAGGTMIGRNGSAVNIDNDSDAENTVTVINHGLMQGMSQNYEDSDGDAVDVDGRVNVENWGTIEGLGHNGYHNGEPNMSEAIAAGAAVIVNHEGGTIYGHGRAIQIDNSGNEDAFAATIITNAGTIKGDGNLPTDVTPKEVTEFELRIRGGEAINLVGTWGDSLINAATGVITGGVKMGGGNDTLVNAGMMAATGGSAVDTGEGDDLVTLQAGSVVTGMILLGGGNDTLTSQGSSVIVDAGAGDDSLSGGGDNDQFSGGDGNDTIAGGDGVDTAIYAETFTADNFALNATLGRWEVDAGGAQDNLTGIERVQHGAGRFLLVGMGGYVSLAAAQADFQAGDVILLASEVSTVTDADAAPNSVVEQAENGTTVGIDIEALDEGDGAGPITFSLTDSAGGRFAIDATTGVVTVANGALLDFEAATSHLITVRVTNQWGDFSDQTLAINVVDVVPVEETGSNGDDTIGGTVESDNIAGGKGDDTLDGGDGDDVLSGGKGADTIIGGDGVDEVSYADSKGGVKVDLAKTGALNGGDAQGDTLSGIENLTGSDKADVLKGNAAANVLDGLRGDDKLDGRSGSDMLIGGKGDDTFVFSAGYGADTITDYKAGDDFDLGGTGIGKFKDLKALMSETGGDVVIDFGDGDVLTIAVTTIQKLSQHKSDFDLA